MPGNSHRVRERIGLVESSLRSAARAMWTHPRFRDLYPEYRYRSFCVSRAAVRGMEVARDAAELLADSDAVANRLVDYFDRHIAEEEGHDDLALEDLEALGFRRDELLGRIPPPAVAALVGTQYYWAFHHHPVAYLGYLAVVEDEVSEAFLEDVIERTRLPRDSFGSLFVHARLEPQHIRDLDELLDSLPLTAEHFNMISVSALTTVGLLCRLFEEVVEELPARMETAAGS